LKTLTSLENFSSFLFLDLSANSLWHPKTRLQGYSRSFEDAFRINGVSRRREERYNAVVGERRRWIATLTTAFLLFFSLGKKIFVRGVKRRKVDEKSRSKIKTPFWIQKIEVINTSASHSFHPSHIFLIEENLFWCQWL